MFQKSHENEKKKPASFILEDFRKRPGSNAVYLHCLLKSDKPFKRLLNVYGQQCHEWHKINFFLLICIQPVKQWQKDCVQFNVQKDYLIFISTVFFEKAFQINSLRKEEGENI